MDIVFWREITQFCGNFDTVFGSTIPKPRTPYHLFLKGVGCKFLEDEFWWIWKAVETTQVKINWIIKKMDNQGSYITL